MGCCEGKNAGHPISRKRYYFGVAFFSTYHIGMLSVLSILKLGSDRWDPVYRFHRAYLGDIWKAVRTREGIVFEGSCTCEAQEPPRAGR